MARRVLGRYLLALAFILSATMPMVRAASAEPASSPPSAVPASIGGTAAVNRAVDSPGHHFGFLESVLTQGSTPNVPVGLAGLQQLSNIAVGTWGPSNAPSFDIQSFDFTTSLLYIAVRNTTGPFSVANPNSGPALVVVNTATNTIAATIPLPDCPAASVSRGSASCPSGVQVMPDLKKVAITSRGEAGQNFVEIFDISGGPNSAVQVAKILLPNNQLEPDELDYDPVLKRLYVANTNGTFFVAVIDAVANTLLGQIPVGTFCPSTMEQPRYDSVDNFVYQNCSTDMKLLRIDPNAGPFGQVVGVFDTTPCQPAGIDIDPLTNQALLGCGASVPQWVVPLNIPSSINNPPTPLSRVVFPAVNASDGLYFDNSTLRWYTGSSGNTNTGVPCPPSAVTPSQFPVLGVFQGTVNDTTPPTIVGVQCTANGAHTVGVDSIRNRIYVPAGVPVNAIMVFQDNTASVGTTSPASASLGANGSVSFTPAGGNTTVQATLTGLTGAGPFRLLVVTTAGNQVVTCSSTGATTATCNGQVVGLPIVGAPVTLFGSNGGTVITRGVTTLGGGATTLTSQQAITQAQGLAGFTGGTSGRACATQVGQQCSGTGGGLSVTGRVTSSMTWTVNATLPATPAAGAGTPFFVVTTTVGVEGVPCTPAPAAAPAPGTVVTCTATTVGNALQGAAAFLVFPGVGGAAGPAVGPAIITGPGAPAAAAAVVAPHLPLLPPPPPPLLPPPPPLMPPPPMVTGGVARMPEVPVIPEADSLALVLGGLAAVGALATWRARRRR